MQNVISELQAQVDTLTMENRDLKKIARIQDKEIKKLDSAEADLPMIIEKHNNEMSVAKENYRRQCETAEKTKQELRRREKELIKTKDKLGKAEGIIKEKNLAERSSLNKKLKEMEEEIEEKQKKITELTRVVQLHEKTRSREMKAKNDKHKQLSEEMKKLEVQQQELVHKLKEKERALEKQNIYAAKGGGGRGANSARSVGPDFDNMSLNGSMISSGAPAMIIGGSIRGGGSDPQYDFSGG